METQTFMQWFIGNIELHWKDLLFLGIVFALYLMTITLIPLLRRKRDIPPKSIRSLQLIFLILVLSTLESMVLDRIEKPLLDKALIIVKTIIYWFFIKNFFEGIYGDIYLRRFKKKDVNPLVIDLFKFALLVILVMGALRAFFNITFSSLLTSSAILTAVVGFAMQDTIGSLISGILIQLENPFAPGDWIKFDDITGKVVAVTWRYTMIETFERNLIFIPNNSISKDRLFNYSRPIPQVMMEVDLQVPVEVPPVRVKQLLMEILGKASLVASHPKPRVRIIKLLENRIDYRVGFYVRRYEDTRPAQDEIYTSIWYEFKREGIEFPYPTREIRMFRKKPPRKDEVIGMLKAVPLFSELAEHEVELLVSSANVREYPPQAKMVSQGDTDSTLFVIIEGRVEVKKREQTLAELGPGDFFGEMALLTGEPRNADVVAMQSARCLILDREGFKVILEKNQYIISRIREMFRERVSKNQPNLPPQVQSSVRETLFSRFMKIFNLD